MVRGQTVAQPHCQIECLGVVHRFECSTHAHQYTITDGGLLFSDKLLEGKLGEGIQLETFRWTLLVKEKPMKYPYHMEYLMVGSHQVPVMRLPQEIELVTTFLSSDVQGPLGEIFFLEHIDLVLQGKELYQEVGGNVYALEIRQDITRVVDTLADEETSCVIETEELRQLIEIWIEETKESKAYNASLIPPPQASPVRDTLRKWTSSVRQLFMRHPLK